MDSVVKRSRPRVLPGVSVKIATGCGNMYVHLNWHEGKLFEVFATLGHSGGCSASQSEGLTRSITLGLRCGIASEEYVKSLTGIQCPTPMMFPKEERVLSCADAIGRVVEEFRSWSGKELVALIERSSAKELTEAEAIASNERQAQEFCQRVGPEEE